MHNATMNQTKGKGSMDPGAQRVSGDVAQPTEPLGQSHTGTPCPLITRETRKFPDLAPATHESSARAPLFSPLLSSLSRQLS